MKIAIVLGIITLPIGTLVSLPVYLSDRNYLLLGFDIAAWIVFTSRLFSKSDSYKLNAYIFFFIIYFMVTYGFIDLGPVYARPAWLVLCSVMAALMFGRRGALVSTVLNILILLALHGLIGPENEAWAAAHSEPYMKWLMFVTNHSIITLAAGLSIGFLVKQLGRTLKYEHDIRLELAAETEKLRSANARLENEIEQRRHAEEALSASEEKYRLLIENIPSVTWISDENGKTIFISPNVKKIFGYTPEEIYEYGDEIWFGRIHPDEAESVQSSFQKMFTQKHEFDVEYKIKRRDGAWIWIHDKGVQAFEKDGTRYAYGVFTDVTERKLADETLRESEERFKLLFDNAPDGYFLLDREGRFLNLNKASEKITGYRNAELIGKRFIESGRFSSDQVQKAGAIFEKNISGAFPVLEELILTRKDGSSVFMEIHTYPLKIQNQFQILGIARDITERKLAEEEKKKLEYQLTQAQKMEAIGTLAGGIAHDFNNILTVILGYTELAKNDAGRGTAMDNNLGEVLRAGDRAKELVNQILVFSRYTEHELKPIQVKGVIKEVLKLIRASLPSTIEIRQNIKSDSTILADPVQILQILMNLCTNAGHAMREGGMLEISLTDVELDSGFLKANPEMNPGRHIQIIVRDTGHGMTPEIIERIFDPYFTTKAYGEGTGLGLAVVHGIVKSYRGAITVQSESGKGSTFNVFLPVLESEPVVHEESDKTLPRGSESILFIDDEPVIAGLGKHMLEKLGYTVTTKTSSVEALELFRAQPDKFDLVITDMTMPGMTGDVLAGEIMRVQADIPIMLCTGFSHQMNEEKAIQLGIKSFILKPFVLKNVAHAIRKVLDKK